MAMERYNPTARASSRQMPSNGATPGNLGQGDPVNGYPFGSTTPGYIDYRDPSVNGAFYPGTTRQQYRDDPNARKLHTPGSDRNAQMQDWIARGNPTGGAPGFRFPSQPTSYAPEVPQEEYDRRDAEIAARKDATYAKLRGMSAFQDNFGGLDLEDPAVQRQIRTDPKKYAEWRRQLYVAKLNLPENWNPDPNADWPKPRSPLGAYSHGPGSADWDTRFTNPPPPNTIGGGVRRGATPTNAPMSAGMPPSRNPMFEGYQGGGAGVPSGGSGNWGPAGGMPMGGGNPLSGLASGPGWAGQAFNPGGGNPFASMGGGETGMMYPGGGMSGGVSPQLINMLMQMRGGGMGAMPMGGNMGMMGGGYNPYANFGMY